MSNESLSTIRFASAKALEDFMTDYAQQTGYKYSKGNTKTLEAAPMKRVKCNPNLVNRYYDYTCIRFGQYVPTGKGKKKTASLKTNCPAYFKARITDDGQFFWFKSYEVNHNHPKEVNPPESVPDSCELQSTSSQSEAISTADDSPSQCVNSLNEPIVVILPTMHNRVEAGESHLHKEHDDTNTIFHPVQDIIIVPTAVENYENIEIMNSGHIEVQCDVQAQAEGDAHNSGAILSDMEKQDIIIVSTAKENIENQEIMNSDHTEVQCDVQAQAESDAHNSGAMLSDMEKQILSELSEGHQEVRINKIDLSIDTNQRPSKDKNSTELDTDDKNQEVIHKNQYNKDNKIILENQTKLLHLPETNSATTEEQRKNYNAIITSVRNNDEYEQPNVSLSEIEFPAIKKTRGRPRGTSKTAIGLPRKPQKTRRNISSSDLEVPIKKKICEDKLNNTRVLRSSKKNECGQQKIN